MSAVNYNNKCKECDKEFEDVLPMTTCVGCFSKNLPLLKPTYSRWQPEVFPHDMVVTRTLSVECGCETTAEFCTVCGEILTEPKTDC